MATIDNEFHVRENVKKILVDVRAWPTFLTVEIHAKDDQLTPSQARELAANLLRAADLSDGLDWSEDAPDNDPQLVMIQPVREGRE